MKKKAKIATLVSAAIMTVGSVNLSLAEDAKMSADAKIHCYGVAKAGKNDCKTSKHSCAGKATVDNDKCEFMVVDKTVCTTKGGSMTAGEGC